MNMRHRKDMIEISSKPVSSERHDDRITVVDSTLACGGSLQPGDARVLLALVLFVITSLLDLVLFRRTSG